jgi:hypothetical protein
MSAPCPLLTQSRHSNVVTTIWYCMAHKERTEVRVPIALQEKRRRSEVGYSEGKQEYCENQNRLMC